MDQSNLHLHRPSCSHDPVQAGLDQVTLKLARPSFLRNLSPSRLPSQAATDCANSKESSCGRTSPVHHHRSPRRSSTLSFSVRSVVDLDAQDLTSILTLPYDWDGYVPAITAAIRSRLNRAFLQSRKAYGIMAAERNFQTFSHGHQDLVLAVDFNYFGTRMVTASSDHRLKVWDRKDESWVLVDSWRAHDAEIVDVKWNGPFIGEILGSIGEDGRFKLWQEDVTEIPMSGRRFKLISNQSPETRVPFMSLDFKNIMQETWIAAVTRDGFLNIYEPLDHHNLSELQPIVSTYVCPTPARQDETSFRVSFHKEHLPCYNAVMAGLDRKALSLAVAAMDTVQVYRTDKNRRFYIAAKLEGARNIIRDVAWANGSMRGYDVIATASKDGAIRIYELYTPQSADAPVASRQAAKETSSHENISSPRLRGKNAPSGIGAGLAGASRKHDSGADNEQNPGRVYHEVKLASELTQHHGAVWRVAFSQMGDLLVSTGDDGTIRTWKRAVSGEWLEYAEIDSRKDQQ